MVIKIVSLILFDQNGECSSVKFVSYKAFPLVMNEDMVIISQAYLVKMAFSLALLDPWISSRIGGFTISDLHSDPGLSVVY